MKKRPNIVIFNPDSWRGDVMGHLGHPAAVTPNLDALVADEAISIDQAYCQNPVCTPSRCSFMSGWYPHTMGHRTMRHMLHPERGHANLLKILKDSGYHVVWSGKNDLAPGQDGHQTYCDEYLSAPPEDGKKWGLVDPEKQVTDKEFYAGFLTKPVDTGGKPRNDYDWRRVMGALDFIKGRDKDTEKPFCLFMPLSFPHPPYSVEQHYYDRINPATLPPRPGIPEDGDEPLMRSGVRERMGIAGWSEAQWQEVQRIYYAMCCRLDDQFGMLTDALKDAELYDDTAVFVFSDHGDYTGDYRTVEKSQNTFEDCLTQVPFMVKPPAGVRVKPGVRNVLAELVDFPATVYDLCGIEPGYDHFGRSLLPLLAEEQPWRDAVFCEGGRRKGEQQCTEAANNPTLDRNSLYWPRQVAQRDLHGSAHGKAVMCRTATHKYVRRMYEKDQLFNLAKDPQETVNVIDDPAYGDIVTQMEQRILNWYMETCDVVPYDIDERNFG